MFDLKTLRIKKGVRQVELAAEAGTTVQYIWMLENGERKTTNALPDFILSARETFVNGKNAGKASEGKI